ncbi:hypothetical protein NBM05_07530 [Rothia sp. AR01]|uniref:Uncharacterized protein n=1 Tax=Rothia santali TaxID=2949643 RepID=A0A9X2KIH9_9MICC|nr:DUF6790 family protein [Rothia santali]MCP3425859.1 hypothetical protein [Rothia santali]
MISTVISDVLSAVIGNYMTSCFVLGLLVAAVRVARLREGRTASAVSGIFLDTFLLYGLGVAMAINFVMHSVFGDFAARTIGWAQSPFQLELALSSLAFALVAIMAYGRGAQLRAKAAVVIGAVIFGLGAAGGHIYQSVVNHDYAVNNTGLLLVSDIAINLIGLAFLVWHAAARRSARAEERVVAAETLPAA